MQVIIMAGGKGERIEGLFPSLPKVLLPIGNQNVLDRLTTDLKEAGASNIIICTGHLADKIETHLKKNLSDIKIVKEDSPLGTVGALGPIKHLLEENFIVLNGDIMASFNYRHFYNTHLSHSESATVAIKKVDLSLRYGLVHLVNNQVVDVREKPSWTYPVLMGVYAFKRKVIEQHVPDFQKFDMPDLLKTIIREGGHIQSYEHDGNWMDIGTPEDYRKMISQEESFMSHEK